MGKYKVGVVSENQDEDEGGKNKKNDGGTKTKAANHREWGRDHLLTMGHIAIFVTGPGQVWQLYQHPCNISLVCTGISEPSAISIWLTHQTFRLAQNRDCIVWQNRHASRYCMMMV